MFERYTEQARRALFFARYEASEWGSPSIQSEHLLLGLMRADGGVTRHVLARYKLSLETVRQDVAARRVPREKVATSVEMPFTEECQRILQFATEESGRLQHNYIGSEHLLLGVLREEHSVAGTVLMESGLRLDAARQQIVDLLNQSSSADAEPVGGVEETLRRVAEENAELRAVIRELQKGHDVPLQFRENAYWLEREGRAPEGPYCSTCWDVDRRLSRKSSDVRGNLYCEYCSRFRLQFGR